MLFQMCVVILQDGFVLLHGITNNSKILKNKTKQNIFVWIL